MSFNKNMKKLVLVAVILTATHVKIMAQKKLIPVKRDYKYGYAFYEDGPLILPAKYDDAQYFEEGLAAVKLGEKWGFIDETGTLKIPIKYDYASLFVDGYVSVGQTGSDGNYKYGLLNKAGTLVIPCKYDGLGTFSEGLISVQVGNKMGFMNIKGVMIIPLKFDFTSGQMGYFSGGYAIIQAGKKYLFIDKTGKELTPPRYSAATEFREGMAPVAIDTSWNKVTSDGSKITSAWGFIDTKGKEVIRCKYENVSSYENGFARAYLDGYELKIDKTGNVVDTLAKPVRKYVAPLDSTTFSGKINKMGRLTLLYSKGFIKKIMLNDEPVYNLSTSPINIDIKKLGLKSGNKATLKVVYTKGTNVKFLAGQDLE
jgi:hypothetical protein